MAERGEGRRGAEEPTGVGDPVRPRVVAVGGGHGLFGVLSALRLLDVAPTAVVTVADDGGSSGRLRRDLGIIAPGDLRMALLALARNTALAETLAHRFGDGELAGHALGNLLLVALTEREGDVVGALRRAGQLLDCQGEVLPSTTEPVELHARAAGRHLDGQVRVQTASSQIEEIWLEPAEPAGCPQAVTAIDHADVVLLGPGSLFTSVVVNLLVPQIAKAVSGSRARLVHVANVRTQVGETSGMSLDDHLRTLLAHLHGRPLDATVVHDGPVNAHAVGTPLTGPLRSPGVGEVVAADLVQRRDDGQPGESHDPARLAAVLATLLGAGRLGGAGGHPAAGASP